MDRKNDAGWLAELMNGLADSVVELSEEEVLAEEREAGADPMQEAAQVRALLRPDPMQEAAQVRSPLRPIRIVIADDHPIFRDGLRRLLEAESDLKVIGEAADGGEAVKLARQLEPDILLLDLAMPRTPGLEALREMSSGQGSNAVRVILLTAAAEKNQIVEALQLGARGVVLKDSATQLLLKCIHTVMAGEYWVGRESVSNLVQYLRKLVQASGEEARQKKFGLTPRELEVVSAVVAGFSNKQIAEHFKISEDTVKHHVSNIFDKVGVSTRLELALFAVNHSVPLACIA
jgi:two-component system, NarL family, nitrate/nitrite response regulator NarL